MTSKTTWDNVSERLWSKVGVRGPDECWEWRGMLFADGYGVIKMGGRHVKVHRVVYELTHGQGSLDGLQACHTCDNARCVNPRHIYAGTHQQNHDDKRERKRAVNRRCGRVVFRGDMHRELIDLHAAGESIVSLAARYGVTREAIKYHLRAHRTGKPLRFANTVA